MALFSDIKHSVTYPFNDSNWLHKLWPLPLIAAMPLVGLVSIILLKGWRFEMVRNLANGVDDLPDFDLVLFFKRGLILWAVMLGHIFVPAVVCGLLGIGGPLGFVADIYEIVTSGFSAWARSEPSDWLLTLLVYAIWAVISFPVFQTGMIRYALSNDWKSMLNAPLNTLLFIRYMHLFIKFYLCWLILSLMILCTDLLLAATGIGLLLIPVFTVCVYYISSAHELGHLARRMNRLGRTSEQQTAAAPLTADNSTS